MDWDFWLKMIVTLYVGMGWIAIGFLLAVTLEWQRIGRISVFLIGLLTGMMRIDSVIFFIEMRGVPSYGVTWEAFMYNAFIAVGLTSIAVGLYVAWGQKGTGA